MIGVDTSVLVTALDRGDPAREKAVAALRSLAESPKPWAVPWFVVIETLRVGTHPKIMKRPAEPLDLWKEISSLTESPSCRLIAPGAGYAKIVAELVDELEPRGNDFYDLHIAATCIDGGVREFWTADRGFRRFRGLHLVNPLEG